MVDLSESYASHTLVCSSTFEDHLQGVFTRLRKAGLKLKPKWCLFLRDKMPYLGHVVTKNGIKLDPSKTDKMRKYPVPMDIRQVRQFLGLTSYYQHFVPNFSMIASPAKAGCHVPVDYRVPDCIRYRLLVSAPILAYPQFSSCYPFILETDTGSKGLGAATS